VPGIPITTYRCDVYENLIGTELVEVELSYL